LPAARLNSPKNGKLAFGLRLGSNTPFF